MISVNGLATTLKIIDSAASIFGNQDIRNITKRSLGIASRANSAGGSVAALAAQTTILSRVFVDSAIVDETIIPNMMRSIHELYTAQIIAALHLSQMVDGHRTVQDVMSVVQTGHNRREKGLLGNIASRRIGQESFLENYTGRPVEQVDYGFDQECLAMESDAAPVSRNLSVKPISPSEHRIGPLGELYEVKLTNPNDKTASITVPVFIQMQPSLIPAEIAPRFVDMNVSPSLWQRWTEMRAGEKTFWLDFILQRDIIRRQKVILKDPAKAEAFAEFLKTVANKDKYALDDVTDKLGARQSSNLANSVVIFSEEAVAQAKADSGVDLHNPRDRQRYFRESYTMMIVIVDPFHQRVTMYFNGLDGEVNSSYNDFRPKDAKFDPKELMSALQAFSTNNISRLR